MLQVNNDRSHDYTNPGTPPAQPPVLGQPPGMGTTDGLQASPTGAPGYPGSQYEAVAGQPYGGTQQQMWGYDQNSEAQPGSNQPVGQPMPGQQQMYMSHQPPGIVPGPPGHHSPPGPVSHYQGPPGISSRMQRMPPPGHMGAGIMPPGSGPNPHHVPPPPGHSMPPYQQQMHGPGPQQQGIPANNGGPPVYYM